MNLSTLKNLIFAVEENGISEQFLHGKEFKTDKDISSLVEDWNKRQEAEKAKNANQIDIDIREWAKKV